MRIAGIVLVLLGLVVAVVGTFSGCGSLFSWNGRHPIESVDLGEGATTKTFVPEPGRRYTLSIQAVFEREGLPKEDEVVTLVEAKMPLVARVKDPMGTTLAEAVGWLDPNERPNVLYGQTARERERGPMPELVVERLVGPFSASSNAPLSIQVDLGADRLGKARVLSRRLVVHDDRLPPGIRNAFLLAGAGAAAFVAGVVLTVVGWFKRRRRGRKRGGIPASDVV